jgi:type II restriction enzyme
MNLNFDLEIAEQYTSPAQKIRVLSESWVGQSIFCPNCGREIEQYSNNAPVADFYCKQCKEDYELKSKKGVMGIKITDGAYTTMMERLQSDSNPNLFLLNYDTVNYSVKNFFVIPKYFFIPKMIEKRKPLTETARRAGWVGCNILLKDIPRTGKIFYVKDGRVHSKDTVISDWKKTLFLREEKEFSTKGWLIDVMRCIERLGKKDFSLEEMYRFEEELKILHPENNHVKDKIRQQLQVLRDKGYLSFVSPGRYRLT